MRDLFFDLFLVLFTGFAVGFDLRDKRIPNWLILPGAAGGVLVNALKGSAQLYDSLLGLGLGIGILLVPFAFGWLGAGDVKFLGALGAILGAKWLPAIFLYSALVGGIMALAVIAFHGMSLRFFKDIFHDFKLLIISRGAVRPASVGERGAKGVRTVPYGVAIGLGTLVAYYIIRSENG